MPKVFMIHGWVDGKFYDEPTCPNCGCELRYEEECFYLGDDPNWETDMYESGWVCLHCQESFIWESIESFENQMFYIAAEFMNCVEDEFPENYWAHYIDDEEDDILDYVN